MIARATRTAGLAAAALPIMQRLAGPGEALLLSRRFGRSILILDIAQPEASTEIRVDGIHVSGIQVAKGTLLAVDRGVTAQALLAFLPRAEIDQILSDANNLYPERAATASDARRIYRQLYEVRQCGFASSWDEFGPDHGALSVPIHVESGAIRAALTIIASSRQLSPDRAHDYARRLNSAADIIGTRLETLAA